MASPQSPPSLVVTGSSSESEKAKEWEPEYPEVNVKVRQLPSRATSTMTMQSTNSDTAEMSQSKSHTAEDSTQAHLVDGHGQKVGKAGEKAFLEKLRKKVGL